MATASASKGGVHQSLVESTRAGKAAMASTVVITPAVLGCPRCRLLQSDQERCAHCGEPLVDVRELAREVMTGVALVKRPTRTGWRDGLAAFGSGSLVVGGTIAGVVATGSPLGL